MTGTKILSVKTFQSYTDFRVKVSQSHLSRRKSVCLFLNITTHCVSLCFFPPTPLAMPISFVLLGRTPVAGRQRVFMWYRKLPDSKLALPCHFDPFLNYVVLARVKTKQRVEKRNIGTGSEQIDAPVTDSASIFVKQIPYFYLGYTLNPLAGPTCSSQRKAKVLALVANYCHSYCVGKKQCGILVLINLEKKSNHSKDSMALSSDSQTF